jgi:hypothetical protein
MEIWKYGNMMREKTSKRRKKKGKERKRKEKRSEANQILVRKSKRNKRIKHKENIKFHFTCWESNPPPLPHTATPPTSHLPAPISQLPHHITSQHSTYTHTGLHTLIPMKKYLLLFVSGRGSPHGGMVRIS